MVCGCGRIPCKVMLFDALICHFVVRFMTAPIGWSCKGTTIRCGRGHNSAYLIIICLDLGVNTVSHTSKSYGFYPAI